MDYETMELEALQTINWPSRHSFQHTVDIEREIREIIEKTSDKHLIEGLIDYLDRSLSQTYSSEYNPVDDQVYDKIAEEIISRQKGEKIDFLDRQKKYVLMSAEDQGYIDSEESLENQRAEIKQFLLEDYGRNFLASRNDSVKKDISRNTLRQKAKDIVQGTNQASHILPDLSKENARENEMCRAVNRGYVKEFKLGTPWHPFPFLTGKLMTFPFQHEEAFMYHGTFKSIFFRRGEKPEDAGEAARGGQEDTSWKLCNPASIITQGAYWKRNIYGSEDRMGWDNRYGDDITHADKGIFLWAKPGIVGDITLELKVPTENLVSTHGDRVDNTRKMFELYGSPRNWREKLVKAQAFKGPSSSNEFIYKSELPISRITGVMPREQGGLITAFAGYNKDKDEIPDIEILPLDKYVEKLIQEEGIEKIQTNSQVKEVRKKAEYEYRRMQEVQDIFDSEDIFDPMNDACETVLSIIALRTGKNPLKNRSFSEPSHWLVEIIQENKHQESRAQAIQQLYNNLTDDLKDYNRRVDEIFQYLPEEPDSMWIDNIDQLEKWHLRVSHKDQNFSRAKEDVNKLLKKQHEVLKRDDLEKERELMNLEKKVLDEVKESAPKVALTNNFKSRLKD